MVGLKASVITVTSRPAEGGSVLLRRGLLLEYATLGWNVVGTIIVVTAALQARSVALAGFGLDSLIEILASLIVVWQLKGGAHQRRDQMGLRAISVAFLALAAYVLAAPFIPWQSARIPRRPRADLFG